MSDKPERPGPIGELPEAFGIERMAQLVVWIVEAGDYMTHLEAENKRLTELLNPMSTRDAELRDD